MMIASPAIHWHEDFNWAWIWGSGSAHAPQTWQDWTAAILFLAVVLVVLGSLSRWSTGGWREFLVWLEQRGKNPVP